LGLGLDSPRLRVPPRLPPEVPWDGGASGAVPDVVVRRPARSPLVLGRLTGEARILRISSACGGLKSLWCAKSVRGG